MADVDVDMAMVEDAVEGVSFATLPAWAKKMLGELEKARMAAWHYRELAIAWHLAVFNTLKSPLELQTRDRIVREEKAIREDAVRWLEPRAKAERNRYRRQVAADINAASKWRAK